MTLIHATENILQSHPAHHKGAERHKASRDEDDEHDDDDAGFHRHASCFQSHPFRIETRVFPEPEIRRTSHDGSETDSAALLDPFRPDFPEEEIFGMSI